MNLEEFREIIEKPAVERALYFEPPGLVNELIKEVVQMPGALPLLSFTLSQLYFRCCDRWHLGGKSRALTKEDCDKLGGVMGAFFHWFDVKFYQLGRVVGSWKKKER